MRASWGPAAPRARPTLLIAAALCLGAGFGVAHAGAVVLLKSAPRAAYESAAAGYRAAYQGTIVELSLEDADADALERGIRDRRPDAVVAVGLKAALFAHGRLPRVPLVFCALKDPERHGLAGAWVTGVSLDVPVQDELSALRAAAPDVRRVAIFYGKATGVALARAAHAAAAAAHVEIVDVPVADLSQLDQMVHGIALQVDAWWLPPDPTVATPEVFRFLLGESVEHRKPLMVFSDALVRAGALVAVAPDYASSGARAAEAVRRIQAGERAGDIPVTTVRRTRIVLNQATARALGREVPATALRGAEVLQ